MPRQVPRMRGDATWEQEAQELNERMLNLRPLSRGERWLLAARRSVPRAPGIAAGRIQCGLPPEVDMYQSHFGLHELPFGLTPDTSYAYTCASYQAALNTLLIAVKNGEGFIKITGEVGTGKTLLCR